LKQPVLDFPQLGLIGELTNEEERDSNNEWVCRNSRDVQKETEDYELQKIAEDPFNKKARRILQTNTSGVARSWIL
jgi:hypothetical protein